MSNIKSIRIDGMMTFDVHPVVLRRQDSGAYKAFSAGYTPDEEVLRMLGQLSLPSIGFKVEWSSEFYVDNDHNGRTCFYNYVISGREAVSDDWINRLVQALRRVGIVREARSFDVENPTSKAVVF